MTSNPKNFDRLYENAKKQAVFVAGGQRAFDVIGTTFRQALVAQEILSVVDIQDPSVSAETVRTIARELRERMFNDASLLVG